MANPNSLQVKLSTSISLHVPNDVTVRHHCIDATELQQLKQVDDLKPIVSSYLNCIKQVQRSFLSSNREQFLNTFSSTVRRDAQTFERVCNDLLLEQVHQSLSNARTWSDFYNAELGAKVANEQCQEYKTTIERHAKSGEIL
jgi:replication fork clamp-binding protein CrfC